MHFSFFFLLLVHSLSTKAQVTDSISNKNVNTDSVYTKPEVEARFPGGDEKWNDYIKMQINKNLTLLLDDALSRGVCDIKFIINSDGTIIAAEPLNMHNSELAKVFKKAILKGPKWIPAQVNGINVKSVRMQKVAFKTQ